MIIVESVLEQTLHTINKLIMMCYYYFLWHVTLVVAVTLPYRNGEFVMPLLFFTVLYLTASNLFTYGKTLI